MAFIQRTSIHGRRLGISATGGLISAVDTTGGNNSSAFNMAAQMWGPAMAETVSSGGAAVSNTGVTIVSSDSTGGMAALVLGTPAAGVQKEVIFCCSASLLTLETSATTILFATGGSTILGNIGSTILTIGSAVHPNIFGASVLLRGVSTALWAVTNRNFGGPVSS